MSLVVSDPLPLHYLVLAGAQSVLPGLFQRVVIPPGVYEVSRHLKSPPALRQWVESMPPWMSMQKPKALNLVLDVDGAQLEAICLAREIKASALLMDDHAGRNAAVRGGVPVVGTIALLEQGAAKGMIELPKVMERLRQATTRLDSELLRGAFERFEKVAAASRR